jgi:hypothetical protein
MLRVGFCAAQLDELASRSGADMSGLRECVPEG